MTELEQSNRELAEKVIKRAAEKSQTIGTVESCTGGLISQYLTTVPGSSQVYHGSIVAYANRIKLELVGVDPEVMMDNGAVSEETAFALAQNGRQQLGTDLLISVTGIAGPGGDTPHKPVGLVYIGFAKPDGETLVKRFKFGAAGRDRVREMATQEALRMLNFYLA